MSKKIISLTLALIMALGVFCPPAAALEASELGTSAVPTASTVLVNGESVAFDAYNIDGNNYFKLRDLAYTLNGTAMQFNVGWDAANNAITLTSGQGYTVVGGEMSGKGGGAKTAVPTTSKIIKDGNTVSFTAYNIDGNNYFKLRDIGEAFDFGVDWDGAKNTIVIDTGKGYAADNQTPGTTEPTMPTDLPNVDQSIVGAWSAVPTLQIGHVKEWVEFKSDGTFTHYNSVFRNDLYYMDYQLTKTGKYTASNGKIYCTNVKETYKVNAGAGQSYENKSVSDCVFLYKFEVKPWDISEMNWLGEVISEGTIDVLWLQINFSPDSNDNLLNVYTDFAKPFEE